MEPQGGKLAYLAGGLGIILLIVIFAWLIGGQKRVVSPIPEEGVKVIFVSPSPLLNPSPSPEVSPTPSPKASPKPSPKPTPTPKPTPETSPTPTASPSPTVTPAGSPSPSPTTPT